MNERPLVTVGGLIVASDGDILLVQSKKWHDLYSVPGGKVEAGETREEAFHREILEETNLKITNVRFAIVQECIFSPEFWKKCHYVMNDFIADLDPSCSKEQVNLNDEAYAFCWILPQEALNLPLHHECRKLIEWYIQDCSLPFNQMPGIIGVQQHHISCIVGIYPEERQTEQLLLVDLKIKVDFSDCLHSKKMKDSFNYCKLAELCTSLAHEKKYFLLENFADDILTTCFQQKKVLWGWVCIQKPAAIPTAAYAFVELERYNKDKPCGHL